jgi:DNA-binding FrmR family transcriptional regulator
MSEQKQDKIISQLKRIRGQIDGLIRMYDDERACIDIVRQVVAARNSLGRVARDLLTQEATKCSQESNLEKFDQILKELFKH